MELHRHAACAVFLSLLSSAHAQIVYDQMKVDDVLQDHIGMGTFSRDLPLPPGRWRVLTLHTDTSTTTGKEDSFRRGSVEHLTAVLGNEDLSDPIALVAYSFTPRAHNIDWGNSPCVANTPESLVDKLDVPSPSAALFGCATAQPLDRFKSLARNAQQQSNAWWRLVLSAANRAEGLPDQAVMLTVRANAYLGRSYAFTIFARQEAPWSHAGYTAHLQQWMHHFGKAALEVAASQKTRFPALPPYSAAQATATHPVAPQGQRSASSAALRPAIMARYERTVVTPSTFVAAMRRCVTRLPTPLPWPENNIPQSMVDEFSATTRETNLFAVTQGVSVCVPRSPQGYPVFALESLQGTVTAVGVSETTAMQWLEKVATRLATTGNSAIAYRLPTGEYQFVAHSASQHQMAVLRYYTRRYPADTPAEHLLADEILEDPALTSVYVPGADAQGTWVKKKLF